MREKRKWFDEDAASEVIVGQERHLKLGLTAI